MAVNKTVLILIKEKSKSKINNKKIETKSY